MMNFRILKFMKKYLLCLIVSILFLGFSEVNTPVRFDHYSTANGLPNDFILSIVQDNIGFMWFGTHLGIVRFDGYRFYLYQPDPLSTNSLSYKHVSFMYADLHGNIWVRFTEYALNRFETETGKFYNYTADTTESGNISSLLVNTFFEDRDSVLWIGTNLGIEQYRNNDDSFLSVLPEKITNETFPNINVHTITDDSLGNLWFRSSKGIGCLKMSSSIVHSLGELTGDLTIDNMYITSLCSDRKSKLWFGTWDNGVFCYDITKGKVTNYLKDVKRISMVYMDRKENVYCFSALDNSLYFLKQENMMMPEFSRHMLFESRENAEFLHMAEDKSGNLWISSSLGLDMFCQDKGVIHYKTDVLQEHSLSSNTINQIFIDETNNLWVSNYRAGLNKADLNQKPFKKLFTNPEQADNIFSGTNITAVMEDTQGYLWVGANGKSILRLNKESTGFVPVQLKDHQVNFSALFEDSRGDIWAGNYDRGIERINPKTLEVTYSNDISEVEGHSEPIWSVRKFVEDDQGDIWFAAYTGVHKWVRKTGKILPYSYLYDPHKADQGFYRTVFIDNDGILWSGSYNGGLARYDTKTNKVKRYIHKKGDKNSISGNGVYVIYEESDSTFLIGTTFGLNRFNKETERFALVQTEPGLYNYSIYTIIPDSLGNYWMASDNGLICLNEETLGCIFYNQDDGLPANEFNTTASTISAEGSIYIGSPKGLLQFEPGAFLQNPYYAKPTITTLRIGNNTISPGDTFNGRVLLKKQMWATDYLVLKYFENDFEFQFSAMHYAVPVNNKFWYMLEGYKDEWIPIEANRGWASFTGLVPGDYIFRLKATNNDGMLCKPEDEVSLGIQILPPFWKTTWFKLAVIVLLVFVVGATFRWRIQMVRKSNVLLEKKVNERTVELQNANNQLEEHREELTSQKETLEIINRSLLETQEKVIAQNKELDLHRNKLEMLVKERTAELHKALDKAEESDRLKSSFLANMSHEIRTPLNAIMGFSSLLQDQYTDAGTKDKYIDTIISSSESLLHLLNNIMDVSRIQSEQLTLNIVRVNMKDLLHGTFALFFADYNNQRIDFRLNTRYLTDDLIVDTDEVRFEQVLLNLLSNAVKFTRSGFVELGVHSINNDELIIYVKDTGVGIPGKKGKEIFERFAKIEDDKNNLYRGVGLGLAICKSLVELWGGRLWYESEENKGTTFYFTHPVSKQKSGPQSIENKSDELPDLKGLKILIAEDEESNYRLLLAYLSPFDVHVTWARNGAEACEMVNKNEVDIILMDIKMPVMTGDEAAKQIKKQYPQIPIIAQTAFTLTFNDDLLKCKIVDGLISKPINQNELIRKIASFV
jgi:signal transduction histidine kinase/ligand-binding sensor domain-containing protein/CheY-like chemotaxis protein